MNLRVNYNFWQDLFENYESLWSMELEWWRSWTLHTANMNFSMSASSVSDGASMWRLLHWFCGVLLVFLLSPRWCHPLLTHKLKYYLTHGESFTNISCSHASSLGWYTFPPCARSQTFQVRSLWSKTSFSVWCHPVSALSSVRSWALLDSN